MSTHYSVYCTDCDTEGPVFRCGWQSKSLTLHGYPGTTIYGTNEEDGQALWLAFLEYHEYHRLVLLIEGQPPPSTST